MADSVYGVQPTGFARKDLATLLAEAETESVTIFRPGIIFDSQSPLGQLLGLLAHMSAMGWETAEDTYQANDTDQAEGINLERMGKLRLMGRAEGESDESFRQAITNAGRARIDLQDINRAVRNLTGVTWARVWINDTDTTDDNLIPSHAIAVAVLGGEIEEIAATIRAYVVPGINAYGNFRVDTVIDGFCRTISFVRPTEVPIWLSLDVKTSKNKMDCPPPAPSALAAMVAQDLSGEDRPANGVDLTLHLFRAAIEARYPNVEVLSGLAGLLSTDLQPMPMVLPFSQIAAFSPERIIINVVP